MLRGNARPGRADRRRTRSENHRPATIHVALGLTRERLSSAFARREYHRAVREVTIDGRRIADDTDTYVIAEIGHNHQGEIAKAKALIGAAAECGVDAVKLQKRDNRALYTAALYDSPYDNENSFGPTYGEHREALELQPEEWEELVPFTRELGVTLLATAFEPASAASSTSSAYLPSRLHRATCGTRPSSRSSLASPNLSSCRPGVARSRTSSGRSRRSPRSTRRSPSSSARPPTRSTSRS